MMSTAFDTGSWRARAAACGAALAILLSLPGCGAVRWQEPAPTTTTQRQASQSDGPVRKSKRGNPPFYEVYGVRYYVLDSSFDYNERGVASWYGKKFHGRTTSSGEIYDMHKMTAAHKTLPLPTEVRVTHLGNGKSVLVTVNDRGPFVDNRIIDLSYAAAKELDMIGAGTALVEVVVLSGPGAPPAPIRTAAVAPLMTDLEPDPPLPATPQQQADAPLYLQVGAFGDPVNARQLQRQLRAKGLSNVIIRYALDTSPTLYRVRLGPIANVAEYDALVELMAAMHILETHLVTDSGDMQVLDVAATAPSGVPEGVSVSEGESVSGVLTGG